MRCANIPSSKKEGDVLHIRVPAILGFWAGRRSKVVLGDFNGEPRDRKIGMTIEAGLRVCFDGVGTGLGYTSTSNDPQKRIDYIFVSPDLTASDVDIPQNTASDHLGVVVTVGR